MSYCNSSSIYQCNSWFRSAKSCKLRIKCGAYRRIYHSLFTISCIFSLPYSCYTCYLWRFSYTYSCWWWRKSIKMKKSYFPSHYWFNRNIFSKCNYWIHSKISLWCIVGIIKKVFEHMFKNFFYTSTHTSSKSSFSQSHKYSCIALRVASSANTEARLRLGLISDSISSTIVL